MPPRKSKTPAGTYTDKETGKTVTKPDSRAPVYGAWKRFRPTENAGYDWFPFSVGNWLTSPLVNAMDLKEQGIYIRLLACQWRDGYLAIHPASLVAQSGIDVRTLVHWMMRFGDETMVCIDHPDGECDIFAMWQKLAELGRDRQRTRAMWRNLAEVSATERHAAVNCRHMANGKLHFLAIKQGKISLAICRGEENRIDGERDGEGKDCLLACTAPTTTNNEELGEGEGFPCPVQECTYAFTSESSPWFKQHLREAHGWVEHRGGSLTEPDECCDDWPCDCRRDIT